MPLEIDDCDWLLRPPVASGAAKSQPLWSSNELTKLGGSYYTEKNQPLDIDIEYFPYFLIPMDLNCL